MFKTMTRGMLPLALTCLMAVPALAQTSTQGSITGTIFDASGAVEFVPLGIFGEADNAAPSVLPPPAPPRARQAEESRAGAIEIALPNGSRVSVDAFVNEKALSRVLRAMKAST